ncbi:hypothetical protein [Halobellus inordinatus]|nr:hypothetical protein [Halobellus ramosii]
MDERTTIPLERKTRKKLAVEKDLRDSSSYDELLNELLHSYGFLSNQE